MKITLQTILKEGDIISNQYGKREILGVCGKVYFTSDLDNNEKAKGYWRIQELIEDDYSLEEKEWSYKELKEQDKYWYIEDGGQVDYTTWMGDKSDLFRAKTNNVFETKEKAEERLKEIMGN